MTWINGLNTGYVLEEQQGCSNFKKARSAGSYCDYTRALHCRRGEDEDGLLALILYKSERVASVQISVFDIIYTSFVRNPDGKGRRLGEKIPISVIHVWVASMFRRRKSCWVVAIVHPPSFRMVGVARCFYFGGEGSM